MSQEQPPVRSRRELRQARDENQATGSTGPGPVSPASKQASATDSAQTQRSSQIRARDRAALRAIKELEEKEGQLAAGGPPTRRQLRLQQLKEQAVTSANPVVAPASGDAARPKAGTPAQTTAAPAQQTAAAAPAPGAAVPLAKTAAPGPGAAKGPGKGPELPDGITVEQALATRALIAEQAKNQLAKMEHIASLDPEAVDPDILAEQIALAERAAVLNRRALAKQKLAEQAAPQPPAAPRPAPSAASNLAMVTPLEFVQVPGIDRPIMKPPATSHVPVVTKPGAKVKPSAAGGKAPAASGRSRVIKRAEAAAKAAAQPKPAVPGPTVPKPAAPKPAASAAAPATAVQADDLFDDLPRIPASSAYGLDPLDAATAGLGRAKRMRLIQFGVLAFGIIALITGVILIISGMTR
ncbi:MAG: hypothetical protein JWM13_535 [Arthrobacter sp.]|nr:hypothetical protein [Arthrobacter sp.]